MVTPIDDGYTNNVQIVVNTLMCNYLPCWWYSGSTKNYLITPPKSSWRFGINNDEQCAISFLFMVAGLYVYT